MGHSFWFLSWQDYLGSLLCRTGLVLGAESRGKPASWRITDLAKKSRVNFLIQYLASFQSRHSREYAVLLERGSARFSFYRLEGAVTRGRLLCRQLRGLAHTDGIMTRVS